MSARQPSSRNPDVAGSSQRIFRSPPEAALGRTMSRRDEFSPKNNNFSPDILLTIRRCAVRAASDLERCLVDSCHLPLTWSTKPPRELIVRRISQ